MSREPAQTWLFPTANKQLYKQAQDGYYLVLQRSNGSNERALYCKQKQSLGWCVIMSCKLLESAVLNASHAVMPV